ncbi:DNA-binding domain-containing protein [Ectobacillus sp. JY-23]|uniref:DNA-binding domain-containing protein n=1 Tax=Ectobacillus sp. JY-23 TaxID=2933872 RepID=UPI001FF61467|nr:DNA-binding domain-containing protein [Ectobacillus sp. JY-23]UOY94448.1 DNA-binding domain-containing protein [Ectobacillus sp. JY-23]
MNRNDMIHILTTLQDALSANTSVNEFEATAAKFAEQYGIQGEEVIDLYKKMVAFHGAVAVLGGEEAYEKSETVWLKEELELLLTVYKFFQKNGISVVIISEQISNEMLSVFPKTKSQLQNTYYKLRNDKMSLENTTKQKPGRKPGQEYKKRSKRNLEASHVLLHRDAEVLHDEPRKNLVHLLSGMIHNFQAISQHNEVRERQMYQLIEGIYELSNLAVDQTRANSGTEEELEQLRAETARLKQEKEELLSGIQHMTANINSFVTSSDIEQIKGLSQFVYTCKSDLHKLGMLQEDSELHGVTQEV